MPYRAKRQRSRRLAALAALLCVPIASSIARAQDESAPKVSRAAPVSPNATINLVNLLVKQGVLTEEQAADLIKQADQEAYVAREATRNASSKAQEAEKSANAASAAVSPPGTKRVTYVPEIVKRELRETIRKEVLEQAKTENWAAPNTFPEWVSRIRFYGDVRVRAEHQSFPKGNDIYDGSLTNFNAINTGNPIAPYIGSLPQRDADINRDRFRLRARLGMEADLLDGFTAGLRLATGDSSSPVSTNATLGGGGGNFSKYPIWLDRGWLRYELWDKLALSVGRFDNPFFAPTDLMFYDDLGFDGIALQVKQEVTPGFTPFLVAGAFPLYNTALNYPSLGGGTSGNVTIGGNQPSTDKYLFGVQGGFAWQADDDVRFKFGAGYFDFTNVQGHLSEPCTVLDVSSVCSTDLQRPSFAQYGNTYAPLRSFDANSAQLQYYGLASAFRVLELTGRVDLGYFNPVHILIDGTYVNNLAFDRGLIAPISTNNTGASPGKDSAGNALPGPFVGGNEGAMARLTVGYPTLNKLWDWNVYTAYKYLESDAVIDAFTDPDFGLGGTNLKGYIIGARLGLGQNVSTTLKWMSANSIAGSPFAVDVLQLDLNGKF